MSLLQIRDLHTSFETPGGLLRAVDGVTIELGEGETIGLVGESGCGKSVTARSVMRLLPSQSAHVGPGTVLFKGRDLLTISDEEMRGLRGRDIAMIFQDPMTSLNPVLTIGEQIGEALRHHMEMDKRSARRRAIELLEMVGIPGAEDRFESYPHQFSGGMRQRVMIAMALSCDPTVILADEVTTALDVTIQAQILELLKSISERSRTSLVLITHDLGVVAGMTQRVYVMYAGRIVETADTTTLFENPRMPYTWGLLRSIPRLDSTNHEQLVPIEGAPPDMTAQQPGCWFAARCPYRRDICDQQEPPLAQVPDSRGRHEARCWGTQQVDGGGWLLGVDWTPEKGNPVVLDGPQRTSQSTSIDSDREVIHEETGEEL